MDCFLVSEPLCEFDSLCLFKHGEISRGNLLTGWWKSFLQLEQVDDSIHRACPGVTGLKEEPRLKEAGGSPQSSAVVSNLVQFQWSIAL